MILQVSSKPLSEEAWDAFVAASPTGHVLQSSRWGRLKTQFGWQVDRITIEDAGHIIAGAQLLFRPILPYISFAYVPKGPIIDFAHHEACQILFAAIHRLARQRGAIFLKVEPDLADDPTLRQQLMAHGFHPSRQTIQPRRTILINLTPDLDDILMAMKPKTRYNVRLAGRREVVVREGTAADLDAFYRLLELTGKRNGFPVHSYEYYEAAYQLFVPQGQAKLFLAAYRDKILAGLMAFALGRKAWYMYGASSDEERHRMPNHALQWAKEKGCHTYDMWGIPDEDEEALEKHFRERSDGFWGLYRFKRGWGGQVVRYVGPYDYVYSPLLYRLWTKIVPLLRT